MGEEAEYEVARAEMSEICPELDTDDDLSYLTVSQDDKQVLGNLKNMADHLKELANRVLEAEAVYKQAQQEYDNYRYKTLPTAMLSAGVQSIQTSDGHSMEIKNKFYCNPNKNDADRIRIGQWLAAHGAGHLVKKQAVVDGSKLEDLRKAGVPYVEKWDMNTNSLKAFLKSGLGMSGGVSQFSIGDIPECIHFTQIDEVEFSS
jgi:hypothetical protein